MTHCILCGKDIPEGGFCYHDVPTPPIPKLFLAEKTLSFYVAASGQHEAYLIAHECDCDEGAMDLTVTVSEASEKYLSKDWEDAIPFGDPFCVPGEELTCQEILSLQPKPTQDDPNQLRLWNSDQRL